MSHATSLGLNAYINQLLQNIAQAIRVHGDIKLTHMEPPPLVVASLNQSKTNVFGQLCCAF